MAEEISKVIETPEQESAWEKLLLAQPQEKLVEILIEQMKKDAELTENIYTKLAAKDAKVARIIEDYFRIMYEEMSGPYPDVMYMATVSEQAVLHAKDMGRLLHGMQLCCAVIRVINDCLLSDQLFDDEKWQLSTQMEQAVWNCMAFMTERLRLEDENGKAEIRAYLEGAMDGYEPYDGNNRYANLIRKFDSLLAAE